MGADRLTAACARNDAAMVNAIARDEPQLVTDVVAEGGRLLAEFAGNGNTDGVRRILDLGNSLIPGWVDLFGGRQSARTIHFIVAWLLVGFVFIHVFLVIITGLWNNLRGMITGQYYIDTSHKEDK